MPAKRKPAKRPPKKATRARDTKRDGKVTKRGAERLDELLRQLDNQTHDWREQARATGDKRADSVADVLDAIAHVYGHGVRVRTRQPASASASEKWLGDTASGARVVVGVERNPRRSGRLAKNWLLNVTDLLIRSSTLRDEVIAAYACPDEEKARFLTFIACKRASVGREDLPAAERGQVAADRLADAWVSAAARCTAHKRSSMLSVAPRLASENVDVLKRDVAKALRDKTNRLTRQRMIASDVRSLATTALKALGCTERDPFEYLDKEDARASQ